MLGVNSLKTYLNVRSVATLTVELDVSLDVITFSDSQMNLPIAMSSSRQK